MMRVFTQVLMGVMLLFGTATLFPRAIIYYRLGQKGRGVLYALLGVLATLFAVMSFGYAYTGMTEGF